MAAMTISSVGVRIMDDIDTLPLFDSPSLDGSTTKVGSLARGVTARAIEKVADFLLLEGDDEDGGNSGTLGWADASFLVPTSFPAFYEFASDLPEGANLVVRASPQPGAAALGQISSYDPILLATGLQGDYISMVHRDRDNPSSPQLQGWMLMITDYRVLLTLKPPLLIIPALGLPENAQLRVRSAPEATAPELGQLSAAPGSIFESAEQCEGWVRVLMDTSEASAWMSTAAKEMQLLQPAQRQTLVMNPELVAQLGEGVKLAVRSAPSQEGIHLGELTCKGRVHCVGERGPWLRVLYQGYKEAWMLACRGAFQLLVRADSIGGDASSYTNSGEQPSSVSRADIVAATPKSDGHRYMVCAKKATVRAEPEFYAMEVGYAAAESIVRVLDEKEEINHAKQTKDVWVRGLLAGVSSADGGGAAAEGSVLEGWIMAFSTKRGATLTDAPDALAAQVEFLKQEEAARAAVAPKVTREPSTEEAAEPTPAAPVPAPKELAPPPESSTKAGGYMRAEGMLKLREEADSLSMELSTITAGELVRVVETSGLWVRVSYRGSSKWWALTANKRGPLLSPVDASAVNAAEFDTQEASAAAAAAARGSEDGDSAAHMPSQPPPPATVRCDSRGAVEMAVTATVDQPLCEGTDAAGKDGTSSSPEYMIALGPLKLRDEADPFSTELCVVDKGGIVKVLETSKLWARVRYHGREDGWVLTANKRGPMLDPLEDASFAAKEFDDQEASYAASSDSAEKAVDPDDRPLGGGKGSWAPPSEFPPGGETETVISDGDSRGVIKAAAAGVAAEPLWEGADFAEKDGTPSCPEYMTALGTVMARDEADSSSMGLSKVAMAVVEERMASRADRKSTNEGVESNAPGDDRPIGEGSGVGRPSGLNDDDNGAAVPPIKPWQRRQKGSTRSRTPSEGKDGAGTQDVVVGGDASAPTQEKPWQKKKREAFMSGGVGAVTTSGSGGVGDGNGNDADDVVGVGSDVTGGVEAGSGDGEGTLLGGGNGSTAKSLGDKAQAEAADGEVQFLGGQMLVLPEGERNVWDDILDAVLQKCPPPTPFRRRRMLPSQRSFVAVGTTLSTFAVSQRAAEQREQDLGEDRHAMEEQIARLEAEKATLVRALSSRDSAMASLTAEMNLLKEQLATVSYEALNICGDLVEARVKADQMAERRELKMEAKIRSLTDSLKDAQTNSEQLEELKRVNVEMQKALERENALAKDAVLKMSELEAKVVDGEAQRRLMHNLIQELRGNVRVFARVRPFLPSDNVPDDAEPAVVSKGDGTGCILSKHVVGNGKGCRDDTHFFPFDKSFASRAGQEEVFTEVSEFVQSALDGFNVCLFSYGQTGSGKTHTMQGSGAGTMRGIIPRAMEQVGKYKSELEAQGWEYDMTVSFLEIYNEQIKDLLRPDSCSENVKHEIKRDNRGNISVSDLTTEAIDPNDSTMVDGIMQRAACRRSVGRTDMNEQSSRSHSVLTLYLKATNRSQRSTMKGTLHLVDLAGSERLGRSHAKGDRLKETRAINKSLSALTDVFVAISNKSSHIPFRNSKLTYLLQPALCGDGKALMMVNLSPTQASYHESLSSLRFASQVKNVELRGTAKGVARSSRR